MTGSDLFDAQERILLGVSEPEDEITLVRGKNSLLDCLAFILFFVALFFI